MKKALYATGLILAASLMSHADFEADARRLARETLDTLYDHRVAPVWETFSTRSKIEYREAFLDYLTALRDRGPAPKPATPAKPELEISFASEKEKAKQAEIEAMQPWELELKRRGFPADLDRVKALDNEAFWQAFLSELYLRDKEFRQSASVPELWPRTPPRPPQYEIEGVAVTETRVFVILRAPHGVYRRLFDPLHPMGTSGARDWGADTPEVQFIWSGTIEDGEVRLDVPNTEIESLTLRAHALKSKKR